MREKAERQRAIAEEWQARIRAWLPAFMAEHPVLCHCQARGSVIFYGSLTQGWDDKFADVDLWLLLPDEEMPGLDARSETRFFGFELDGRAGHLTAHGVSEFRDKVRQCHMDTLYQLRGGVVLTDPCGLAAPVHQAAQAPMPEAVRRAFFMHHYVEMRSEHRACDNPMERHDPVALLLSLPKVLAHALRAAMVLEGEPYPYDKWLWHAARGTPTGQRLAPHVQGILDQLGRGMLSFPGTEKENPIGKELYALRRLLIQSAREHGINEPWLDKWWLHMDQAERARADARWE
jgi:hypothetical protein